MSEHSLEYNLGTIGFVDNIDASLVGFEDGRAFLCLAFRSSSNKRLKPMTLVFTDNFFSELHNLLIEAEVQINKLLQTNRISAVRLPENGEIAFRSNLGSVAYSTRSLSVSVAVMKEGTAFLQLHAEDSKSRSNGFTSIFDDNEFTKLKNIVKEVFPMIIKPQPPQVQDYHHSKAIIHEPRNQNLATISKNNLVSEKKPSDLIVIGNQVQCPNCSNLCAVKSKRCRRCGRVLRPQLSKIKTPSPPRDYLVVAIIILFLFFGVMFFLIYETRQEIQTAIRQPQVEMPTVQGSDFGDNKLSGRDSSDSEKTVNVRGYTRSDGTQVPPYTRSAPDRKH